MGNISGGKYEIPTPNITDFLETNFLHVFIIRRLDTFKYYIRQVLAAYGRGVSAVMDAGIHSWSCATCLLPVNCGTYRPGSH